MNCSRCERLKRINPATYKFNIEGNKGITVIYLYLCRRCWSEHTQVTRDRYKMIGSVL